MTLGEAWPLVFVIGPLGVLIGGCLINLCALGILKLFKVGERA